MRSFVMVALLVASLLGATGCSVKQIEVVSDTCWSGTWDGASYSACGNKKFRTRGDIQCYFFQKETEDGVLMVRVLRGNGVDKVTDEDYGTVSGCVQ